MLKTGPAKEAVMDTFPNPLFAIAMLLLKSPIELPHAITVRPKILSSIPVMLPMKEIKLTSSVAKKLIHRAANTKLTRQVTARPKGKLVPSLTRGGCLEGARASVPSPKRSEATEHSVNDSAPTLLMSLSLQVLYRAQKGNPMQLATKKGLKYISLSTAGTVSVLAMVKGTSSTIMSLLIKFSSLKNFQPSCFILCSKAWMLS
mmetsp:Transcript_12542/g.23602  ORF Transcript_12542/g.23602 Transcript_12542/m.23602 type:complete len:203 (-) Transcript_12542:1364-1972(-)